MKIIKNLLTKNDCHKTGKTITVKGLMLHSVGCSQPSAMVFINMWNKPSSEMGGRQVCVHGFIEPDGDVYQTLPWNHRAWHCGSGNNGSGNNTHIGIEMTEPSTIKYTGGANWTDLDAAKTKAHVLGAYQTAVELFAFLCKEYGLNPLADGVIISHKEGCSRGIASNHGDPEHLWGKFGLTMAQFRKDVKAAMEKASQPSTSTTAPAKTTAPTSTGTVYKVQTGAFGKKDYADRLQAELKAKGFDAFVVFDGRYNLVQVGAFSVKENANAMMEKLKKAGYQAVITQ